MLFMLYHQSDVVYFISIYPCIESPAIPEEETAPVSKVAGVVFA
jgi:hypothetical protein